MLINQNKIAKFKSSTFNKALNNIEGKILELGVGKGDNLIHYNTKAEVYALDINGNKINNLKSSGQNLYNEKSIKLFEAKASELPFQNEFFDYVVFSFFLCSVTSISKVVNEIDRVLVSKGHVIFIEHTISNNIPIKLLQKTFTPIHCWFYGNCHLNRNPLNYFLTLKYHILGIKKMTYFIEPCTYVMLEKK